MQTAVCCRFARTDTRAFVYHTDAISPILLPEEEINAPAFHSSFVLVCVIPLSLRNRARSTEGQSCAGVVESMVTRGGREDTTNNGHGNVGRSEEEMRRGSSTAPLGRSAAGTGAGGKQSSSYSIMNNTFRVDARYSGLKAIGKGSFGIVCSAFDEKQVRKRKKGMRASCTIDTLYYRQLCIPTTRTWTFIRCFLLLRTKSRYSYSLMMFDASFCWRSMSANSGRLAYVRVPRARPAWIACRQQ